MTREFFLSWWDINFHVTSLFFEDSKIQIILRITKGSSVYYKYVEDT